MHNVALEPFDPRAERRVEDSMWTKGVAFRSLFNTDKIAKVGFDGFSFYPPACGAYRPPPCQRDALRGDPSRRRASVARLVDSAFALSEGPSRQPHRPRLTPPRD